MTKEEAKNLVVKTFEQSFDESKFLLFIKNLLNDFDESKSQTWSGNYIPESFRGAIKSYKRLGQYTDKSKNVIDVLTVNVNKDNTLERARTLQRNFIARHLKQRNHEAALVAFYTDGYEDWRFSLVIMELNLTKTKVEIELSPAKRYSFLVGVNERSHTAQNQFVNLLTNKNDKHTLKDIEESFNIETVTKEFFLGYRDLFIRIKTSLDKILSSDSKVKDEFDKKGVDSVNFSKKLLGQIVFLYFLQKKGWFGVARDDQWGEGSKQFLRELFEKKHCSYKNFFNEVLEPLFYQVLRVGEDRKHLDYYYSAFNCRIPFLNGGLFDPIGDYDWVHTDITLPNELFSNKKDPNDEGDGILDVFDLYNFTVAEDEPLEKEVAIDPELLGKAYEKFNAIRPDNFDEYEKALKSGKKGEESKFNKQYGVFYTPREIVHYMCQQSLINYLTTELENKVSKDAIEFLILEGEKFVEHLRTAKEKIEKNGDYSGKYKENEYFIELKQNANEIDLLLANLKMCDPAVGSGAFPVGMMTEIVKARMFFVLTDCLLGEYQNSHYEKVQRNSYNYKRECIENSLYGVDIDAGAVEIAKLRLWLSLVVDEDDINSIKPLPNLDYKIIRGDSLLGFPSNVVKNSAIESEIESLKLRYFNSKDVNDKRELTKLISNKFGELLTEAKQFSDKVNNIFFDFEVFFSEVFHQRKGFDIFVGNPPYGVSIKNNYRVTVLSLLPKVPDYEIFYFFIEVAYKYLHQNAIVSFIIPNSFLFNVFAATYRLKLLEIWDIEEILDCTDFDIFENATVRNVIIRFKKSMDYLDVGYKNTFNALTFRELSDRKLVRISKKNLMKNNVNWALAFKLDNRILKFISSIKDRSKMLVDFFPEISQGLIAYDKYRGQSKKTIEKRAYHYFEKSKPELKPWLRGEDINRYSIVWNGKEYIDYCDGIANPRNPKYFIGNRILVREITNPSILAAFTSEEMYNDPSIIIIKDSTKFSLKVLLGILNSKFATFYHFNSSPKATKGAFPKIILEDIKNFPLFEPDKFSGKYYRRLELLVEDIILLIADENFTKGESIETEIDLLVYKLYNLTYEEVKIIDIGIEKIILKEEYEKFEIK